MTLGCNFKHYRIFYLLVYLILSLIKAESNLPNIDPEKLTLPTIPTNNTRFQEYAKGANPKKAGTNLLIFISITSSPVHSHLRHAIRNSWILPCKASPYCDYRFFIDLVQERFNHSDYSHANLVVENVIYQDMVFRDSCPLMSRHPNYINYGNSPPIGENLYQKDIIGNITLLPDYPLRRLYKIDWKVCFLKWARRQYQSVSYHVFVEDDSFTCTENLLFQLSLLQNITKDQESHFRAGTAMYDGFDDSSTIMDKTVADIFADHYPSKSFNCAKISESTDAKVLSGVVWLSWGNSWMSANCDWINEMKAKFNVTVIKPNMGCTKATVKEPGIIDYPCVKWPLVFHHRRIVDILDTEVSKQRMWHTCEHMLLLDKVKDPNAMALLWNKASVAHDFKDFSPAFLYGDKDGRGWDKVLNNLHEEETKCLTSHSNLQMDPKEDLPCLFSKMDRNRRQLRVSRSIFPASVSSSLYSSLLPIDSNASADYISYRYYFQEH